MKNVLIISNDSRFYRYLINEYYKIARIVNISYSYEEGIKNIKLKRPDIVIVKSRIQNHKIIDLLNKINILLNYQPLVLIIGNLNINNIQDKYKNCILLKEDISKTNIIFQYLKDDDNIENRIKEEMQKMGFEMKNKGDYLILNVIKYIKQNENIGNNLERDIYPRIATINNVSKEQIKWNINSSINSAYCSSYKIMCDYFNASNLEKPTSKFIISTLLNIL